MSCYPVRCETARCRLYTLERLPSWSPLPCSPPGMALVRVLPLGSMSQGCIECSCCSRRYPSQRSRCPPRTRWAQRRKRGSNGPVCRYRMQSRLRSRHMSPQRSASRSRYHSSEHTSRQRTASLARCQPRSASLGGRSGSQTRPRDRPARHRCPQGIDALRTSRAGSRYHSSRVSDRLWRPRSNGPQDSCRRIVGSIGPCGHCHPRGQHVQLRIRMGKPRRL